MTCAVSGAGSWALVTIEYVLRPGWSQSSPSNHSMGRPSLPDHVLVHRTEMGCPLRIHLGAAPRNAEGEVSLIEYVGSWSELASRAESVGSFGLPQVGNERREIVSTVRRPVDRVDEGACPHEGPEALNLQLTPLRVGMQSTLTVARESRPVGLDAQPAVQRQLQFGLVGAELVAKFSLSDPINSEGIG